MTTSASLAQEFYTKFQASKSQIVSQLDTLESTQDSNALGAHYDAGVAEVSGMCVRMRKELNDAAIEGFLPGYDLRRMEDQLKEIEKRVTAVQTRANANAKVKAEDGTGIGAGAGAGKKGRFAFRKREGVSGSSPRGNTPVNANASNGEVRARVEESASASALASTSASATQANAQLASASQSSVVLKDRSEEYISRSCLDRQTRAQGEERGAGAGADLTLSMLSRCVVDFVSATRSTRGGEEGESMSMSMGGGEGKGEGGEGGGAMSMSEAGDVGLTAVRAEDVRDSVLLLGRVGGSVMVHGLEGCVVLVECHQLRIHTSRNTRFFLRVGSDAIIEHCEGLEVGAYPAGVPPFSDETQTQTQRPLTVLDFSHLRGGASPNWRMMSGEEVEAFGAEWKGLAEGLGGRDGDGDVDVEGVLGRLLPRVG